MKKTLNKAERISKREHIKLLFNEGETISIFPFKVRYALVPKEDVPIKFGISVPKKCFKRAVDRNLLKRRCKEAFRLNCEELRLLFSEREYTLLIMPIYISKEALCYEKIENKLVLTLRQLAKIYG